MTKEKSQTAFYAHSKKGMPAREWQPLTEHLENVATLASDFAKQFGGEQWARIAGKYHDLGKGTLNWQAYLRHVNGFADEFAGHYAGHPNHAPLGAQYIYKFSKDAGKLLAYCIAGHHGGLPNWDQSATAGLKTRLDDSSPILDISLPLPELPKHLPIICEKERLGFSLQFFTRMIFSCLVDADYLDTEAFLDKEHAESRSQYLAIENLHEKFWRNYETLRNESDLKSNVNQQRERVLSDCISAAMQKPGLFSLTVPTGGGKTLASLAFALKHAEIHKKHRIIYVVPFTSIIEQNATVFRKMLGEGVVLEHHCNFIPDETDWETRLAIENWDAPLIVTTNVQFFNSFFANKSSKCRKLHNIANSVVIFDEVQAIPVEKMRPCLEVIQEMTLNYSVTAVLCTATQPAIAYSEDFPSGLKDINEIVQDVPNLFKALKRTEEKFVGTLETCELTRQISAKLQVLCIVNTRQQALDLFRALPKSEENNHLSALMYPAHRTRKIQKIRRLLDENKPCRVVSTQIIEAGVDVDFPCVFRSVAGIDSIAQAAGRCNRNGRSETLGEVVVFDLPEEIPCSFFKQAGQSAKKLFSEYSGNLTAPECVKAYFDDYFWKNEQRMDEDGIVERCLLGQSGNIQFKEIAEFEMIKSATIPIIVALEDAAQNLVQALEFANHKGGILRKLQQYIVQIYPHQFRDIEAWLEKPEPGIFVLKSDELYSEDTGLKCEPPIGQAFFG